MKIEFQTAGKYWLEAASAVTQPGAKILVRRADTVTFFMVATKVFRYSRILAGILIIIGGIHLTISEEGAWGLSIYLGCVLTWIATRASRQRSLKWVANNEFGADLEKAFACSYDLQDDQLRYEDPRQIIELPWRQVVRIVETPTLIAISDSIGRVYGIANHAFSDDAPREQFTADLLRQMGSIPAGRSNRISEAIISDG